MLPRDAYIANMEAKLLGWAHELAWLRSKARLVASRSSVAFQLRLASAQGAHQAVRQEFEKLKKSGAERWNALTAGVDAARNEISS